MVVAIAGIVLATRGTTPAPEVTPAPSAAPASTPVAASAPTEQINPNEVVFGEGSDKLPAAAATSLGRFAEAAKSARGVRLSARFLTGANKARDLELAKARAEAIRKVLVANAIGAEKIQVELIEMPAGSLTEPGGNRVDLTLR
jgi:outer membrane protein OmpA-like peptidoglycan-associated protein